MTPSPSTASLAALLACALSILACDSGEQGESSDADACGPSSGVVAKVIDGDTIELESGERVRYLMIDTPENTSEQECYGPEATSANKMFVEGQTVSLSYDAECTDKYDRLLAYVSIGDQVINEIMVERGYACVLHIPPNGEDTIDRYNELEYAAQMLDKGLWAACDPIPCG